MWREELELLPAGGEVAARELRRAFGESNVVSPYLFFVEPVLFLGGMSCIKPFTNRCDHFGYWIKVGQAMLSGALAKKNARSMAKKAAGTRDRTNPPTLSKYENLADVVDPHTGSVKFGVAACPEAHQEGTVTSQGGEAGSSQAEVAVPSPVKVRDLSTAMEVAAGSGPAEEMPVADSGAGGSPVVTLSSSQEVELLKKRKAVESASGEDGCGKALKVDKVQTVLVRSNLRFKKISLYGFGVVRVKTGKKYTKNRTEIGLSSSARFRTVQ